MASRTTVAADTGLAEIESVMFSNLLLLGFDPSAASTKHGAEFFPGMFRVSNQKGMEVIMQFLYSRLRPEESKKALQLAWPIYDKAQAREFRKIILGLLKELEDAGSLPRNSSRQSSIASCSGERFVEMLWQLSAHVLHESHKRMLLASAKSPAAAAILAEVTPQGPGARMGDIPVTMPQPQALALLNVTRGRATLQRQSAVSLAAATCQNQQIWVEYADELTEQYRSLCLQQASLEQSLSSYQGQLRQGEADAGGLPASDVRQQASHDLAAVERAQGLAAHAKIWESIENFSEQCNHMSPALDSILGQGAHRFAISGQELRQLQAQGGAPGADGGLDGTTEAGGAVDCARVVKAWGKELARGVRASVLGARANGGAGPTLLAPATGHPHKLAELEASHSHHLASLREMAAALEKALPAAAARVRQLREEARVIERKAEQYAPSKDGRDLPAGTPTQQPSHSQRSLDASMDGDPLALLPPSQQPSPLGWDLTPSAHSSPSQPSNCGSVSTHHPALSSRGAVLLLPRSDVAQQLGEALAELRRHMDALPRPQAQGTGFGSWLQPSAEHPSPAKQPSLPAGQGTRPAGSSDDAPAAAVGGKASSQGATRGPGVAARRSSEHGRQPLAEHNINLNLAAAKLAHPMQKPDMGTTAIHRQQAALQHEVAPMVRAAAGAPSNVPGWKEDGHSPARVAPHASPRQAAVLASQGLALSPKGFGDMSFDLSGPMSFLEDELQRLPDPESTHVFL
eukprot:jgi/Mesvir1/19090/Mv12842-RA.2